MNIPPGLKTRIASVAIAFQRVPEFRVWLRCLALFAGYAAFVLAVGLSTGFLKPELMSGNWRAFVLVPVLIFFRPAAVEELFFRAILIPHPREDVSRRRVWITATLSLIVFIAMHPLNGYLVRHEAFAVFSSPLFLCFAGLLGIVCTLTYRISGSLWPPILIHWLTVVTWTVFLGGKRLLTGS